MQYIIGVDEVGRGPIAGPITLSAFVAAKNFEHTLVKTIGGKIRDSKQFSEKKREEIYRNFLKFRKVNQVYFCVSHISSKIIDEKGISYAIKLGVRRCLKNALLNYLKNIRDFADLRYHKISYDHSDFKIKLDGSLRAPEIYKDQETIIGGDKKNIFIACASIVAKVRRDRLLKRLAKKHPEYKFDVHKGYGTSLHRKLIKIHGLSQIHRKSFCKNI